MSSGSPSSSSPSSSSTSASASVSKKDNSSEDREDYPPEKNALPTRRPRSPSPFRYLGERSRSPSPSELTDRNSPDAIDINPYGLTPDSVRSPDLRPSARVWQPPPLLQSPCEQPPVPLEKNNFDTKFVFSPAQAPFLSSSILTNPEFLEPDYFEKRQQTLQRMQSSSTCHILKRSSNCSTSSETAAGASAKASACSSGEDETRSSAPNLLSTAVAIVNRARNTDEHDANATADKRRKIEKDHTSNTSESGTQPTDARTDAVVETLAMLEQQDNSGGKGS